jgi:hypothetical protein
LDVKAIWELSGDQEGSPILSRFIGQALLISAVMQIMLSIEVIAFYNRQRLQAKLGFLSAVAYEQRYYAGLLAA